MAQQLSIFTDGERSLALSDDAAIRYVPAVFSAEESARCFTLLRNVVAWEASKTWMYDREVDVPRLTAYFGASDAWPDVLARMLSRVRAVLGAEFTSAGLNFYRDGRDSVAWHSDRNEHLVADPTVAVLSFGAVRTMRVRPIAPPRRSLGIDLEPGSAFVMRGKAQERFEHSIPKDAAVAEPRISVVFRTTIV